MKEIMDIGNIKMEEYKSIMNVGTIKIYQTKHFNWFRKLMYKIAFDIKIEDVKGENND